MIDKAGDELAIVIAPYTSGFCPEAALSSPLRCTYDGCAMTGHRIESSSHE
jgi:hypothetical protein